MVAIIFRDADGKEGVILCRETAHLQPETERLDAHGVEYSIEVIL